MSKFPVRITSRLGRILILICGALLSSPLFATTRTVISLADSGTGTLRDTIAASNDGDSISFSVTGIIGLTSGTLEIDKSITINGPGSDNLEITRASGVFRIFLINGSATSQPTVTISGVAITNGRTDNGFGGGIENLASTLTLNSCLLQGNKSFSSPQADGAGGAINSDGQLTLNDCTVSNNSAVFGSGDIHTGGGAINNPRNFINSVPSVVTINRCIFNGNTSVDSGGAIGSFSTLIINDSTFTDNGSGEGGAVQGSGASITISRSTFSGNLASGDGGAIASINSNTTLTNCTVVGNAASAGGGLYNEGRGFTSNLVVHDCTISANSASNGGGITNNGTNGGNGFVMLGNTILFSTNNTPGANLFNDGLGTAITSQGYNLSSDNGGGFLTAIGDLVNTDPKLGVLQDNGGFTQTMALLPGSPAQDKGKSFGTTTDQRGLLRPLDNLVIANAPGGDSSDIGAFETDVQQIGPTFSVTTIADHDDGTCGADDCTLREAINLANATGGQNTITFQPGLTGSIDLQSQLGTLMVTDSVTVTGPGARVLAVYGNFALRVFHFITGTGTISGLTIGFGATEGMADTSTQEGGALLNDLNSSLTISDCSFTDNIVFGGQSTIAGVNGGNANGGAISNHGVITLNRCVLKENTVEGGHGAAGSNTFDGNPNGGSGGAGQGGAIFNDAGASLTISDSTFAGNNAAGGFGGNGHFGGNGGDSDGGAISNLGTTTLTGCTISGNQCDGGSGGAGNNPINNGSSGTGRGGGLRNISGSSTVRNTIVAGNTGANGGGPDTQGTFLSGGYNLIGIGDFSTGFNAAGDQVGTTAAPHNPLLGPLQNNGGSTNTMALLTGSSAIDRGKAFGLTTDQRGNARPVDLAAVANASGGDGSDIGAFEVPAPLPTPTVTISVSPSSVSEGGSATFTISAPANTARPVAISYSMGGKASLGADYTLSGNLGMSGQVTIPLGANSVSVVLTAVIDHMKEKKESATMTLVAGQGYKLAKSARQKKATVKFTDSP